MLKYKIEVQCDDPSCNARQTAEGTVEQPGDYDLPQLGRWSGPFEGWGFRQDEPSLCPKHQRQRIAAEAEAAKEEES